jgi:Ca2+-transporting ATPase
VTVSFLALAMAQVWHVFNMRERGSSPLSNDVARSPWVWGAVGLCAALLLAAVHLPLLSVALGTESPGAAGWLLAFLASLIPLIVGQAWIQLSPRKWTHTSSPRKWTHTSR